MKYSKRLRLYLFLCLAMISSLALSAPAQAITYGSPDGTGHPNTGMMVAHDTNTGFRGAFCSGSLISPTVFLTAAHCLVLPSNYVIEGVSFDPVYSASTVALPGTVHANSLYGLNGMGSDLHDIGVIVLDAPVTSIAPATLPTLNMLDHMNLKGQKFTSVGYGSIDPAKPGYAHCCPDPMERRVGVGTFSSLKPFALFISGNPALGNAGTCYGDSGGPNFLGSSSMVVGLTDTGDSPCRNSNVTYRTDTASARTFLGQYVALP